MPQQRVIISEDIEHDLADAIAQSSYDRIFVLTDETTRRCCLPKLNTRLGQYKATPITISPSDTNKTIDTLCSVWTKRFEVYHNQTAPLAEWFEKEGMRHTFRWADHPSKEEMIGSIFAFLDQQN